jgi:hypothetical protein
MTKKNGAAGDRTRDAFRASLLSSGRYEIRTHLTLSYSHISTDAILTKLAI